VKKLTRVFVALLVCCLFSILIPNVFVTAKNDPTSTLTKLVYVGTPFGTLANYTEEYKVLVTYNHTVIAYAWYNASFSVQINPDPTKQDQLGNYYGVSLSISILKVSASPNYTKSSLSPLLKPLPIQGSILNVKESTGNFSLRPFFIISPNAPSQSQTITGVTFTVYRLSSYQYSAGSIRFNAPVIVMLIQYSPTEVLIQGKYIYDAKSGLLLYSSNTTVYNLAIDNKPAQLNYTTQVWLTGTNLASINPSATLQPLNPTTTIAIPSNTFPYAFIAVVVIVVVVIALLLVFGRRR
jgi:hypothetical protein